MGEPDFVRMKIIRGASEYLQIYKGRLSEVDQESTKLDTKPYKFSRQLHAEQIWVVLQVKMDCSGNIVDWWTKTHLKIQYNRQIAV